MLSPLLISLVSAANLFGAKTIPNHAIADLVLGQPNFNTNSTASPTAFTLDRPTAVAIDPTTFKVFAADSANNRVLRYPNAASLSNGSGAEAVFGQPNFTTTTAGTGALQFARPKGLFFDHLGRLWVADTFNNRVLLFDAASQRNSQASPDRVYGQPNFTTVTGGTTASKLSQPYGITVDLEDRLWIVDTGNHRVLRFDSISTKPSGADADGVLGQTTFTTGTPNNGSSGFQTPVGVAVSKSGGLFVGDYFHHRVLRFNNAANLGNGAGASAVLGQPNFQTITPGLSDVKMNEPSGLWITPNDSLWVCEFRNNRLIRFDKASRLSNGAAATGVVGQPDFTTSVNSLSNRGFIGVFMQPTVDPSGNLWVSDQFNNRVLRFPPDVTSPLLAVTSKVPVTTRKTQLTIKGTASDIYGIRSVQYRVNSGNLKTATGTTEWNFRANLTLGTNKITIFAVDSVGNRSVSKVLRIKRVKTSPPSLGLAAAR